jgi:hypothetical protein
MEAGARKRRRPSRGMNPRITQRLTTELNPGQRPELSKNGKITSSQMIKQWLGQHTDDEDASEKRV